MQTFESLVKGSDLLQGSVNNVWKKLQSAPNKVETKKLLAALRQAFVSTNQSDKVIGYLDGEVTRTMQYWALWARAWSLTFGLTTSALQEGVHHTLKSKTEKQSMPLHKIPEFLSHTMASRQIKIDLRRMNDKSRIPIIKEIGKIVGDTSFERGLKLLQLSAHDLVLDAYDNGKSLQTALIDLEKATSICESICSLNSSESPSAFRFGILLSLVETGKYELFEVKGAQTQSSHVVIVDKATGSLACSCGEFAMYGSACMDKHIMAAFNNGNVAINMLLMNHPFYFDDALKEYPMREETMEEFGVVRKDVFNVNKGKQLLEQITPECRFDWAIKLTQDVWETKVLLEDESVMSNQSKILKSRPMMVDEKKMSKVEKITKVFHEIKSWIQTDEQAHTELFCFYQRLRQQREEKAIEHYQAKRVDIFGEPLYESKLKTKHDGKKNKEENQREEEESTSRKNEMEVESDEEESDIMKTSSSSTSTNGRLIQPLPLPVGKRGRITHFGSTT